jgi:hypothetical protein
MKMSNKKDGLPLHQDKVLAFPHLAPLSTPMILHLLGEDPESLTFQLQQQMQPFLQRWTHFAQEVYRARSIVFSLLTSALEQRQVSVAWFRETVTRLLITRTPERASQQKSLEERSAISGETVAEWKKNHILRPLAKGQLELDCIAAIFIACLVDPQARLKHFLPSEVDPAEPSWYCYSRTALNAPVAPCPIPLPGNLPNATLLWTPWPGAAWNDPWLSLGGIGAARWAGVSTERAKIRWTLTKDDLRKWDQEISQLDMGLLFDTGLLGREPLHSFANTALIRLAVAELSARGTE